MRASLLAATLAALLAVPGAAQHKASSAAPPDSTRPFVVSISGGLSLGVYMAGVNWTLAELFRHADQDPGFRAQVPRHRLGAVAGASAGSINSLLWVVEQCTDRAAGMPPESSLFWEVWVRTGLEELLPDTLDALGADTAVLDRRWVREHHFESLRQRFSGETVRDCDLPVGVTLTRLLPKRVGTEIQVQTQRFATVVWARSAPAGADAPGGGEARRRLRFDPPADSILKDVGFGDLRVLHPDRDGAIALGSVFEAVEASSSFPIAFAPRRLELRDHSGKSEVEAVVDGGVFDNHPLGLALGLYRHTPPPAEPSVHDSALAVFVNPDLYRGILQQRRGKDASPASSGGMGSLMQLLQGAVPTARQYELQGIVRQDRGNRGRPYTPGVTTRGYPLVSEHLGAFAGFLARPFREFDFYVGVYDGLRFVAERYPCQGRKGDESDARERCVRERLRDWIERGYPAPLGAGGEVLSALYRYEYGARDTAGLRIASPATPVDSARATLMRALARAQSAQFGPLQRTCPPGTLAARVLCGSGFREMLDSLATDTVRRLVERWKDTSSKDPSVVRMRDDARELDDWVFHPEERMDALVGRVLYRMWRVENAVKAAEHTADRRRWTNQERLVEGLLAVYNAGKLRRRSGFEWNSSSVPREAGPRVPALGFRAWDVLPYSINAAMGASGWDVAWRPVLHLDDRWALAGHSVPFHRNGHPTEERPHHWAGVGAGVVYKGCVLNRLFKCDLLFPEASARGMVYRPWSYLENGETVATADFSLSLLAGKFQVTWRIPSRPDRLHSGGNLLMFSFTDIPGLVHWTTRLAR